MSVEVRKYTDSDYDRVNKIILDSFGYEKGNIKDERAIEIVAVLDSVVVGYLILNEMVDIIKNIKTYHIDYVCVDPEYRNQKIGKTMIEYVFDYAKENDVSRLELTSRKERVEAHKLYEKCGFVKRDTDLFRKEIL